ncbi:MAG: helix-turn-helix domain-containing protein [Pollutimonas bauzanensis]|uniref:DNA-binding response regulator, OmpR family, contains REC and winged-helix (WHTH) domain n=1 Tax=Pollutimonas bauzanensis TaxID=658167 RepID=A0A1M5TPT8_9BURK|nr:helix-turn-helix domain-containing protein [Pollutimonas bauzanensis]SHH52698.1 DNA-binding response regulator, OmpR family, contains REC and winged-helix (wHTH) domain [Pollutimonas bauzanensis]
MNLHPVVLLFDPPPAQGESGYPIAPLQAQGFDVLPCACLPELYGRAQENAAQAGAPPLFVLAGTQADNCAAASYLRTLYPAAGILALVASGSDARLAQTLQSGADNYCRRNASTALVLASLLRLLWRAGHPGAIAEGLQPPSPETGCWSLLERGWVLGGPRGQRIPLTTGERAFLTTLFAAPDLRADHRQLIDAVNSSYSLISPPTHQARLGLLVSRLRRKFRAHGAEVPLKSVHSWGYMFTGTVA